MTKVYHKSKELIVLDKLPPKSDSTRITIQHGIINAVGGGIQIVYNAREIWFYNDATGVFISYKVRSKCDPCLLTELLGSRDIHICTSGYERTLPNETMNYCFATERDKFLFKLKF